MGVLVAVGSGRGVFVGGITVGVKVGSSLGIRVSTAICVSVDWTSCIAKVNWALLSVGEVFGPHPVSNKPVTRIKTTSLDCLVFIRHLFKVDNNGCEHLFFDYTIYSS